MNNKTTATAPLRPSETVDVLMQQILGNIARDGQGQFYTVEPNITIHPGTHSEVFVKDLSGK
jgi:hypothetical protein